MTPNLYWNLIRRFERREIATAYQLQQLTGLPYPTAARVFSAARRGDPIDRFDVSTLRALSIAFRARPLLLLSDRIPEGSAAWAPANDDEASRSR